MSTVPGFSSRSTVQHFRQFPQRDEAVMSDMQPEPGFSNSDEVKDAPQDVYPDVEVPEEPEPGFSNSRAVAEAAEAVESVDEPGDEPEKKAPAKKAASKTAARKKG